VTLVAAALSLFLYRRGQDTVGVDRAMKSPTG
jgi:hypothetical protein